MVSMKALMSLSKYEMGVLDGIAKTKDMLVENNSCNGKISRLIENFHSTTQAEMVGIVNDDTASEDEEPISGEQMEYDDNDESEE